MADLVVERPAYRVLLADDAAVMRRLVRTWLEGAGLVVTEASDGVSALALAQRETFDLIFLDVNMPGLTGLNVLDQLRASPRTAQVPVVLVTTLGRDADLERGRQLGASEYLTKPLAHPTILEVVDRFLPRVVKT